MSEQTRRIFTLAEITTRVQEILQPATRKRFWLRAEISSGKQRAGHFYCDLVETDAQGRQIAKLRATIWDRELSGIRLKFAEAGLDLELEDGTEVCLLCGLRFHAVHGLSLAVYDADPEFALGELELRRRRILLKLEEEGLFEPNKMRNVPLLPQRIGVVTSVTSAAFQDFYRTLQASPFGFTVLAADAAVQGRRTEIEVLAGIRALRRLRVDVIAIIRGGGSKTELSFLDSEAIARQIAACPIPVWTGIGHEIDTSVLDFVANQCFKTPTALAVALVERFAGIQDACEAARVRLQSTWRMRRDATHDALSRSRIGLIRGTRKLVDLTRSELDNRKHGLAQHVASRLIRERSLLGSAATRLKSQPQYVLADRRRRLGEVQKRLQRSAGQALTRNRSILAGSRQRFRLRRFMHVIEQQQQQLSDKSQRFRLQRLLDRLETERASLAAKRRMVRAADPQQSLNRGYSLSYDANGRLITSVRQLAAGSKLAVHVRDGIIHSTTDRVEAQDDER